MCSILRVRNLDIKFCKNGVLLLSIRAGRFELYGILLLLRVPALSQYKEAVFQMAFCLSWSFSLEMAVFELEEDISPCSSKPLIIFGISNHLNFILDARTGSYIKIA